MNNDQKHDMRTINEISEEDLEKVIGGLSSGQSKGLPNEDELLKMGLTGAGAFGVANILTELASTMKQMSAENRQSSVEARISAREEAQLEMLGQADAMRGAADKMMAGAAISSAMGIVGGAVSLGGSMHAAGFDSKIDHASGSDGKFDHASASGALEAHNSSAKQAEGILSNGDAVKNMEDAMNTQVSTIINFLKEMQSAKADALRAITRL